MLKLRRVDVAGFKSFSEKTHLTFSGTGLTCIVGPNGCGKSNVVDAISWVLGEQSHKSLRAERMSDCIFNGTVKRPPMGMAEVTLTLVDLELSEAARKVLGEPGPAATVEGIPVSDAPVEAMAPQEPIADDAAEVGPEGEVRPFRKKRAAQQAAASARPGEVVIGRRLYRSGQSEYLINGRSARLRDIQDLFMGIGLGPDSYAIIEQGRIGQVLSSKPSDRRAIIEEAAGITKYKTKKRLAEAKLESSRTNLARVNDIYVEVEKQLASLKRQASKARRYAEIREQMRGLLRQILAGKTSELHAEAERLSRLVGEISTQEAAQAAAAGQLETEQSRVDRRSEELDAELRQNQNVIGMTALELDRAENRIVFNRQRAEELRLRGEQLTVEASQLAAQCAQVESQALEQETLVAGLRTETTRMDALLLALEHRTTELAGATEAHEAKSAALRRQIADSQEAMAHLQETERQTAHSLAHNAGVLEHLQQSEARLLGESSQHKLRAESTESRWQDATTRARALEESVQAMQMRLAALQQERQQAAGNCELLRDTLTGARARRQTLERILNDRSYSAEAVQKLFAASGSSLRDFRAVGMLADYAEVEPQYETAVEQFLREELEYVVVATFDHARAGISILRDEVGGRATFFVDSLRALQLTDDSAAVPFASDPTVISRLDELVQFRDPLGAAAKQFLPRLQTAFLVSDSISAERLSSVHPAYNFLTPDGTCYQGRAVTGGRPAEAGPLVMKREMRTLEAEILNNEEQLVTARATLDEIQTALRQAERDLEILSAQAVETGKALVAASMDRDAAQAELARVNADLSSHQSEIARLRSDATSAQLRADQLLLDREHAATLREAAEHELLALGTQIGEMRKVAEAQQEELSASRAEKAALDERLASFTALAARLREQHHEIATRSAGTTAQQDDLRRELGQIEIQNAEQQQQVQTLTIEKQRLEVRRAEIEQECEQCRQRAAEVDNLLRFGRQKLSELREERGRLEIDRARNDAEREHLRTACLDELNAQPEDLLAEQTVRLSGEELAAADSQHREMKSRIESMGPVNMMALEEYNECEQRFGFLGRERQDLLQSITDTEQAITELDLVSRQKFEEAFAVVNAHFATAFQTLFGGGTGQMRLSEPDTSGDAGIDIVAQPPGKRLQNVLLLSGGEKALTALALLIAIFRYQPSPFCILDEVDAPLDETNVGRFAQMVAEMSVDAQFIVVTHNRRTMEKASALYGVTMQEPGVSKIVSVSWEQARAAASSHAA